jgi:hypothetical protein
MNMKDKDYTDEELQAALARCRAGESPHKVARETSIPRGTLDSKLRRERAHAGAEVAVMPKPPVPAEDERSEAYTTWLGRLRAGQETLEARLAAANQAGVAALVAFGTDLLTAKGAVKHGEWLPLLDELHIGHDKAEQLMSIAQHEYIAKSEHARNLPAARTTLAELSRLPAEEVEEAVDAGEVTPDSERVDVKIVVSRRLGERLGEGEPRKTKPRQRKKGTIGLTRRLKLIIDTADDEIPEYIGKFPAMYDELFTLLEQAGDRILALREVMEGQEHDADAA